MKIDDTTKKVLRRCGESPAFFLDNFGRVSHPSLGIIPFKLFSYQKECLKEFLRNRFSIFRKTRQAGISALTGGFALWYAMFFSEKTILVVSKRERDCIDYLRKNVKIIYENLPNWLHDLFPLASSNEHEVVFPNGSRIKSLTSSKETMRSYAASLNIIDEAAFCVPPHTLITMGDGSLKPINEIAVGEQVTTSDNTIQSVTKIHRHDISEQLINIDVEGVKNALQFTAEHPIMVLRPHQVCQCGCGKSLPDVTGLRRRSFEHVTLRSYLPGHSRDKRRIPVQWQYIDACNVRPGDWVGIPANQPSQPQGIDNDLAYLIGLFLAEGSYSKSGGVKRIATFTYGKNEEHLANKTSTLLAKFFPPQYKRTVKLGSIIDRPPIKRKPGYKPVTDVYCYLCGANSESLYRAKEIPARYLCARCGRTTRGFAKYRVPIIRKRGSVIVVHYNNDAAADFMRRHCGEYAASKRISNELFHKLSFENIHYLIAGWMDGDGFAYQGRNNFIGSTASCDLWNQLYMLLIRSGIRATQSVCHNGKSISIDIAYQRWRDRIGIPTAHNVQQLPIWRIRIGATDAARIADIAYKGIHQDATHGQPRHYKGLMALPIKTIQKTNYNGPVYNLSVDKNPSFLVNNIATHNCPDMESMWQAGYSTLAMGGSAIVVSTTNGIGGWYWQTWTDAEANQNDFKPIQINWWDMDWRLEYTDKKSNEKVVIAPTDGIRKCETKEEIEKYGPYWSPWLEQQYRQLTQKGDSSKFRQEILADFLGTGNTVLSRPAFQFISSTLVGPRSKKEPNGYRTVGIVDYVNPNTDEPAKLDFQDRLWVWNTPIRGTSINPQTGEREPDPETGEPEEPHIYVAGCDVSSGDASDFSTIQVFDVTDREQVAELQIKTQPRILAMMIDYLGRWYNNAFAIVERSGMGVGVCQELFERLMYQHIYRRPKKNIYHKSNKYGDIGFNTSVSTKPMLNKALIDCLGDESGFMIKSPRLYKELLIYVHLKGSRTGCEPGTGNNDDLVIGAGLALFGINQAAFFATPALSPVKGPFFGPELRKPEALQKRIQELPPEMSRGMLMPMSMITDLPKTISIEQELKKYSSQLGGISISKEGKGVPKVNPQKHIIKYRKSK